MEKKPEIYSKILSTDRFRETTVPNRNILLEAESDKGRLLFCPAFRRLQQKAQVFSLESNAAVRSRLTHSLEVAHIGRYISDQISQQLQANGTATELECSAISTFVETACLMHDIGNPPFGHFGEFAISHWFEKNADTILKEALGPHYDKLTDRDIKKAASDFIEFDGNPQGLRIITKLQKNYDDKGLNLTKTTIASYLKYIRAAGSDPNTSKGLFVKKCGYFSTEKRLIEEIWSSFDYRKPQRFPLAYIMEAADDIAYCISDLEDSIEKGLLNKGIALQEIFHRWENYCGSGAHKSREYDDIEKCLTAALQENATFIDFRTKLNRLLVTYAAEQYVERHDDIINGESDVLIPPKSACGQILKTLKEYCKEKVYVHESVQKVELAGYEAIFGLLEKFSCLLRLKRDQFESIVKGEETKKFVIERKILSLFPKNYIGCYKSDLEKTPSNESSFILEWVLRGHLVTDFISGMTDDFAIKTYQTLSGIKI